MIVRFNLNSIYTFKMNEELTFEAIKEILPELEAKLRV